MTTINGCQCGTLNNSNCTMAMNAEHRSKFATLHCQWWPLNHFHIYLVLKGRSRTSAPGARDPVWTYFGIVFINFDCIVCTYFKVVQNTSEYFLVGFFGEFFVPLVNFSLIWRRHHWRWRAAFFGVFRPNRECFTHWWRAANFDLCSAVMAV